MCSGLPLHSSHDLRIFKSRYPLTSQSKIFKLKRPLQLSHFLSSQALLQDNWNLRISTQIYRSQYSVARRVQRFTCYSFARPESAANYAVIKLATSILTRSYDVLHGWPLLPQLVPAVGVIAFTIWGLGPFLRLIRNLVIHKNDPNWKRSRTYYIFSSYLQPIFIWIGITLICRALDPIALPSDASNAVKLRILTFFRSLATVLAFAYCFSSLIQAAQKFFTEKNESNDARNMGIQFASRTVNTAVWIAASSLFMELLGFSTQKWLTAGGLGTVLLTLAGREIFTNFLSSVMIHATRPFIINDWIQTKIEGYEISGTVEHVGWWSPTIIRGDDREAIHIPNHKFNVTVVRNLTQKAHWRIKTHFAISHLDADKISNIVADMRKVLAKNPQVEQQRLHRRVFLDFIKPENQALMILISCFVKTSHFEEYLCVKEAVILDLLKVICHHRARLATPIRTVQKAYSDTDLDNVPFADPFFTRGRGSVNRPLYLIEPKTRVNGDRGRMGPHTNEEQFSRIAITLDDEISSVYEGLDADGNMQHKEESLGETPKPSGSSEDKEQKEKSGDDCPKNDMSDQRKPVADATSKTPVERKETVRMTSKESAHAGAAAESSVIRSSFEENMVLGVALDGAKRTLPIEEGMPPKDTKELASVRIGNGSHLPAKDKIDGHGPTVPSKSTTAAAGQRDKSPGAATGQWEKNSGAALDQRD